MRKGRVDASCSQGTLALILAAMDAGQWGAPAPAAVYGKQRPSQNSAKRPDFHVLAKAESLKTNQTCRLWQKD